MVSHCEENKKRLTEKWLRVNPDSMRSILIHYSVGCLFYVKVHIVAIKQKF